MSGNCQFERDGKKHLRCRKCGYRRQTEKPPDQVRRNCGLVLEKEPEPGMRGLGDLIAWGLRKVGVKKKCGGCRKRQRWLNTWVPFRK